MKKKISYWIVSLLSIFVATASMMIPDRYRPLDFHAMFTVSIPLAIIWLLLVSLCIWRFKLRGLWLIAAAPFALWWPIWLLFNHLPACYYAHNCI